MGEFDREGGVEIALRSGKTPEAARLGDDRPPWLERPPSLPTAEPVLSGAVDGGRTDMDGIRSGRAEGGREISRPVAAVGAGRSDIREGVLEGEGSLFEGAPWLC